MVTYTQEKRPIALTTPLGKDALLLTAFSGQEDFSRLFHYDLELLSERKAIAAPDIVGKNVTFWVEFPNGQPRYFNGFVQRFAYCGTGDRLSTYRAQIVPWLWFLTRTSDCRIFQDKSVPEIIATVLGESGFKFDKSGITQTHAKWEYCVQYRETDFNFVSRLMEHEGIFYWFKHEQGQHTLMLADGVGAYQDCVDKQVQLLSNMAQPEITDQILSWEHQYEFRSGKWVHTDYNFQKPTTNIQADTKGKLPLAESNKYEFFDYPGEYEEKGDGTSDVKLRMEEEEAGFDVVSGQSICRSFGPGGKFTLAKHHNPAEQGKSYVLTSVRHEARVGASYVTGVAPESQIYHNAFTCIPAAVPFRPSRQTPKPLIQGVQTAVVVGPAGDEIYTDKFGRIKVQFYWDRLGKKDEHSSCWIRCAQSSAGKGWGAFSLPRIGQEVVVTYLEGDPDRPLVTGVVYNQSQMPPYDLPAEKTKTYFKSNSSKGGSGFNELRFEDSGGKEQLYMHAQKDMDLRVLNDQREIVLGKKHLIVGGKVGDQLERIDKDKHVTIKGKVQEKVTGNVLTAIAGEQHTIVDKTRSEKVGKDQNLTIGGARNEKVTGKYSLQAKSLHAKTDSDTAIEASTIHIKAAQTLILEAGMKLSLKVGGNFVDVSVAGVAINGMPVLINSGGAAGSGMGCSPTAPQEPQKAEPTDPEEADKTAKTGQKSS